MANPNPEIWGAPSSWVYTNISYGLESTVAKLANADKPKCKNFGSTSYDNLEQTLFSAVTHNAITLNTPLDRSLCPCGIAPEVSPWAKLAIFNENNDLSTTPSRTIEINDANTNWFFCNFRGSDNNAYTFNRYYAYSDDGGLRYQQFAPRAITTNLIYNQCLRIAPWLKYGIKSVLLTIQVRCIEHNATNPITGTFWVTLDDWKNNYPTYDICGLRFFVRACSAINSTTLALTYSNDDTGDKSGQIAVIQDLTVNNNGENIETEFLSLSISQQGKKDGYIFDVSPRIYNWSNGTDGRTNRAIFPCWYYFDNQTINFYKPLSSDPVGYYYYKIPYSDDTYNKIMRIAACFGCFFTPTNKYQFAYDMLDDDLYLTVLDDNGVAHGQYTHGADNANNSLYTKSSIRDIDYNPDAPPTPVDPNAYSNVTGFNSITNNAALTKFYVLDSANVEKLGDDLWTICDGLSSGDFQHFDGKIKDEFLTTNPIDSIIALKRFPFNVPHTFNPNKIPVQLGKSTGTAQGYRTYEILFGVNFKGVDIFPRFGDCFLDYSPYTKYELYIPFCGTVEINAGDILGHTLNCQLRIDLLTGSCIAYIMADQLVIGTSKGSCGVDMQMSGAQTATMNANIFNGILNAQLAETQHITSIGKISLNPFKWYENIEVAETRQLQTQHDITHMVVPLHKMGSASPLLSWVQEFNARLMIYYPEGDVITNAIPPELNAAAVESFGHIKGFATATPGKVSNFQRSDKQCYLSGNIVADNIPCTDNERQRIIATFNAGVYLPSL